MSHLPLSPDLEHSLLSAVLAGVASPDAVTPEELSKQGQLVLAATRLLPGAPPHHPRAVYIAATDVLGGDRTELREYVAAVVAATAAIPVTDLLRMVHDKRLLVEVINTAGEQLRLGRLDVGAITSALAQGAAAPVGLLQPVAELIREGLPPTPEGLPLTSLPRLAALTGGVYGLWAISGEPGCGKSTLAWQIILDAAATVPVLLYDFENGFAVLMDRSRHIFGDDVVAIRGATQRVFVRDSIRTLEADLAATPAPALIVVDSVQRLPASVSHYTEGLGSWVHRLEGLKHRGYTVLLVSEIARYSYTNAPAIGDFKSTGAIEYSADLAARLLPVGNNGADVHIVKNRHRPHRGLAVSLERHNDWAFRESESAMDMLAGLGV